MMKTADRFPALALERIELSNEGCWLWTGRLDACGYGRFGSSSAHQRAHLAWVGQIPKGLEIDHACHDPKVCRVGSGCPHRRCINPAHLELGTRRENVARGGKGGWQTHCKHGHEFTPE